MLYYLTWIITLSALFNMSTSPGVAQCSNKSFLTQCASSLEEYQFGKAYKVNEQVLQQGSEKNKIEYSYVMKKGTNYKLSICSEKSSNRLIARLYDNDHNLLASSYNKEKDKHYPAIGFECNSTGTYYITYTFEKDGSACGLCILGFK